MVVCGIYSGGSADIHVCGTLAVQAGHASIDKFSEVTIHEGTHRTHYEETHRLLFPATDTDDDWLKDSLEISNDLNLNGAVNVVSVDYEAYSDNNGNGQYDVGEPFVDTGLIRKELTLTQFKTNPQPPATNVTYGAGDGVWTSEGTVLIAGTSKYHANSGGGPYDDEDDACYATSGDKADAKDKDFSSPGSNF